jgi:hypothetical protein
MNHFPPRPSLALLLAAGLLATTGAATAQNSKGGSTSAAPGVVTLDQARAEAGGVTPGDAPGFPITISQPGHYRLMGPLATPNAAVHAIEVTASAVTIDLNGFAITGPLNCNGGSVTAITCLPASTESAGVAAPSAHRVTVRNGSVRGFGYGVLVGQMSNVEGVDVAMAANDGIATGHSASVVGNTVSMARFHAIASDGQVRHNNVYFARTGVQAAFGSLVEGNRLNWVETGIAGIYGTTGAAGNAISVYTTPFYDVRQMGANLCNGALCP